MATHFFKPFTSQSYGQLSHLHSPIIVSIFTLPKRKTTPFPFFCTPPDSTPVVGPELSLCVETHVIPHPKKVDKGGEDAFFVSNYNGGVIAVAAEILMALHLYHFNFEVGWKLLSVSLAVCGPIQNSLLLLIFMLGSWAEQNVNPALFSQELMANAYSFVGNEEVNYDPRILIKKAHATTASVGSATEIVAMLEKNGILKIFNVWDCGLRLIRKGQITFATSPQEHYFDCPYQLSSEAVSQTYLDAMITTVELMRGDIVVMGSDGLFDNIFDHEIVSTVAANNDVSDAAKALTNLAYSHSLDLNFDSPYSQEARARGFDVPWWKKVLGVKLTGGKLDDITVIIGQVERS